MATIKTPLEHNQVVVDTTVSWANSAAAGTAKTIDVALPAEAYGKERYLITITNPSTETALTVKSQNKETFGANTRYAEIASHAVAAGTPNGKSVIIEGWLMAEGGRITLSNDTAVGTAGTFTAEVRVRKV